MKKAFYVFACILLICACDKTSLDPDNGSVEQPVKEPETTNNQQQRTQFQSIVVKSDDGEWSFSYGQDGKILQYTSKVTEDWGSSVTLEMNSSYSYSYSGSVLTETISSEEKIGSDVSSNSDKDIALVFLNGCIDRWMEITSSGYREHYYEYEDGFLTLEEYRNGSDIRYTNYIWEDSCLAKITKQDADSPVYAEYSFTYGEDSNPYYGSNCDPIVIWFWPGDNTGWKAAGLMGNSSKRLPVSVKYQNEDSTITYSIEYTYSSGSLSGMNITSSSNKIMTYSITSR